jgi:hypothetical protein
MSAPPQHPESGVTDTGSLSQHDATGAAPPQHPESGVTDPGSLSSRSHHIVASPAPTALITAATGRATVITGPSSAYVNANESAPFSGVLTRNDTVAPLLAPVRRSATAAGTTEHEHSGNGTPITAARTTGPTPRPPSHRASQACGINPFSSPAMISPNNNHGAASSTTAHNAASS